MAIPNQLLSQNQFNSKQNNSFGGEAYQYDPWMNGLTANSSYNDYLNLNGMGNATQPMNNPTTLPGGSGSAPIAPFGNLDEANQYGYNQALGLYNQGPTTQGFGDTTQQAHNMIQNLVNNPQPYNPQQGQQPNQNPWMAAGLAGAGMLGGGSAGQNVQTRPAPQDGQTRPAPSQGGQMNPWISGALNKTMGQLNQANPFLQGLQGFGNQQNEAFEGTVNRALDNVTDRVNSQFGLAGRTNSGAHGGYMTDSLGDVANQMYSDNFQQNQNRSLQALGLGADVFGSDQGRMMNAAGMLPDLANSRFNDARVLSGLGLTQDQMNQRQADSGWDNLQKYMNIVSGSREQPQEDKISNMDRILGITGQLGSAYLMGL